MSRKRFSEWLRERQRRLFPERQIFIRSNGSVRFVRISGRQQMALLMVPAAALAAVVGAGSALFVQSRMAEQRDHQLVRLESAQTQLEAERASLKAALLRWGERYEAVTSELERKHRILTGLTESQSDLEGRVYSLWRLLALLDLERESASSDRAAINARFVELREQLTHASFLKAEPEGSLTRRPLRLRLSLGGALAAGPLQPLPDTQRFGLNFDATKRLLALTAEERDAAREQKQALERKVAHLENRVSVLHEMQSNLIGRIAAGTERHIGDLEQALALTGLDVDDLLDRIGGASEGMGGPLISVPSVEPRSEAGMSPRTHPEARGGLDDQFELVLHRMGAQLARLSALSTLAERLPLTGPVTSYEIRSHFGKRRDPISRGWAQHEGIDLASDHRAAILATAPGVVTFAGWKGPFGRLVEIDHGYGLITRYAHLYRINVKRGERVVKQQQIGIMGSSGRSTGRHLHYEVHFDDRPLDPMTFLKAGDHVFKNGQN